MMQLKKVEIQWMDPASLIPYSNNARIHSDDQILEIIRQVEIANEWDQPIVIDENKIILKGHGRREAAMKRGWNPVPVIMRTGLTQEQKIAIRLGDNKVAELAEWDKDKLKFDLQTLKSAEFDLAQTSFRDFELAALVPDDDPLLPPDASRGGGSSEKSFTIQYTLIFNDLEEQQKWFEFLGMLKREYPHLETVSQRVLEFVSEKWSNGQG